MDSFGLLLVVATGLVAFHVAIALYLYRVAATTNGRSSSSESERARLDSESYGRGDTTADRPVRCGSCGTPNDPTFRFCRQCIANLSGSGSTTTGAEGTDRLGS